MPINPSNIGAADRAFYVGIGKGFGSAGVLAQADKTVTALGRHGSLLVLYGFSEQDGTRLVEARRLLETAGVKRESTRAGKKGSVSTLERVQHAARTARAQGRNVLEGVDADNRLTAAVNGEGMGTLIRATLSQTARAGRDATQLAAQLELLRDTLRDPAVAAQAQARGGAEVEAKLTEAATGLRGAMGANAKPTGTPVETEELHLLDGIVVNLVRRARKAARSAGRALAQPAMSREFALTEMYKTSRGGVVEEEEGDEEGEDAGKDGAKGGTPRPQNDNGVVTPPA